MPSGAPETRPGESRHDREYWEKSLRVSLKVGCRVPGDTYGPKVSALHSLPNPNRIR